jgi:hypothetical protein
VSTYIQLWTKGKRCGLWSLQERRQRVIFDVELVAPPAQRSVRSNESTVGQERCLTSKRVIAWSLLQSLEAWQVSQ